MAEHVKVNRSREPVEIETRIQLAPAGEPLCPKRDFVFAAIDDAVGERRFKLVPLDFALVARHQVQDVVSRIARLRLDPAVTMITEETPARHRTAVEAAICDQLFWRRGGSLDHADVIDQHLTGAINQTKRQLAPQRRFATLPRRGNTTPRERSPLRLA